MATDYKKYTWRNIGQKELKEIWFAAWGSYSPSNQTVDLSALSNFFGTGNFAGSVLTHAGDKYLVNLHFAGGATNPLPLTYKKEGQPNRENKDTATAITDTNVVEVSMATGLKVDAYRIRGQGFLRGCWQNQEIADSITEPFVEDAETVHQTTLDLNLPSNMTYIKLPRYGFTEESADKVGVDGLFDSAKEQRAKDKAIGSISAAAADGTKTYEPGFKWDSSLMINGKTYDTSRLKDWGFAERVPIVLADSYSAECDFQLPEIKTLGDDTIQVKCKNSAAKIFKYGPDDLLTCNIQHVQSVKDCGVEALNTFPPQMQTDAKGYPLYTWYEKGDRQDISHTVTDILIQPHLTVQLSPEWEIHQTALEANTNYQTPNTAAAEGSAWPLAAEDPALVAPLSYHQDWVIEPSYADITFDNAKQETVSLPQGGTAEVNVDAPMRLTFKTDGTISGVVALSSSIDRHRTMPQLAQSENLPVDFGSFIGEHLFTILQHENPNFAYSPFFSIPVAGDDCCGNDSIYGYLTVSCLPAKITINNLLVPWTKTALSTKVFQAKLLNEGPKIFEYTRGVQQAGQDAHEEKKTISSDFHNCPTYKPWYIDEGWKNTVYIWNWNVEVLNTPFRETGRVDMGECLTKASNESFYDLTTSEYRTFADSLLVGTAERKFTEIAYNEKVITATSPSGDIEYYVKMTDPNWGSHIMFEHDTRMCSHHVVFILWSKLPDAYEYLKKQLLKSP